MGDTEIPLRFDVAATIVEKVACAPCCLFAADRATQGDLP